MLLPTSATRDWKAPARLRAVAGTVVLLPTPRARIDKEHGPDGKHWGELRPVVESLLSPTARGTRSHRRLGRVRARDPALGDHPRACT